MLISTKGRYALRIMIDLAEHQGEGFIPLKVIAGQGRRLSADKGAGPVYSGRGPAADGGIVGACGLPWAGCRRLPKSGCVPYPAALAGAE